MIWWRRLTGRFFIDRRIEDQRWVVLDVESSGLDPRNDRLLAIAGVAVCFRRGEPRVEIADSFEVTLHQEDAADPAAHAAAAVLPPAGRAVGAVDEVDRPNILLHGIGVGAQRAGVPPAQALESFLEWVGGSPLLAYHAAFDRTLIHRYCQAHVGRRPTNQWLDLEHLVSLLVPGLPDRTLDSAMAGLGVGCLRRHQAAADTLATADLLLRLWPLAKAQMKGRSDFRSLAKLAARHRWLRGQEG